MQISSFHKSKEEGKDQEPIQSNTTPDPGHHMRKCYIYNKASHTRERRGQSFPSRRPQGCKEQTRQYDMKHKINQKKHHLETSVIEVNFQSLKTVGKSFRIPLKILEFTQTCLCGLSKGG